MKRLYPHDEIKGSNPSPGGFIIILANTRIL
jgi:hypothetical protein